MPTEAEFDISNLGTICQNFRTLVLEDRAVEKALKAASRADSPFVMKQRVRAMLKHFVSSLQAEVQGEDSEMAALFRGRTQAFASEIVRWGRDRASEKAFPGSDSAQYWSTESEENDSGNDGKLHTDDDSDSDGEMHTEFIDPAKFLSIVGSSASFERLLDEIHDYGFPSLTTRLLNLHPRLLQSEPKAERILSELMYAMPLTLELSTTQPSAIDTVKSRIEIISGESWDWWPLAPPRKELSERHVAIVWPCVSHETFQVGVGSY